jgi:hypothetical protein
VFASKTDIQAWLENDKILVDDANSQKSNIEATRVVKGALAGFFAPIVITSWADPDSTPELIRGITGRLAASFIHAKIYSEESDREVSAYSQWLYTQAMLDLNGILNGNLTVVDENGEPVDTTGASLLSFFPDNTTTPLFTIAKEFS